MKERRGREIKGGRGRKGGGRGERKGGRKWKGFFGFWFLVFSFFFLIYFFLNLFFDQLCATLSFAALSLVEFSGLFSLLFSSPCLF